jgi:hypothetical protein
VLVEEDKDGSVPYSNQASVDSPLGFAVPLKTALVVVMEVGILVVTAGEKGVVKSRMGVPCDVPPALVATTRK